MKKIYNYLKKNILIIIALIITISFISKAFYTYFKENYGYSKVYNEYKEICKKDPKNVNCQIYNNLQDPKEKFSQEETRNLYFKIVYDYLGISLIAPFIIILLIVGILHQDFSSGNIKNYLMRQNLKDYRKKMYKTTIISALILPSIILFIFTICALITKFNFQSIISDEFNSWNYENFPLYLLSHCLILYLSGILYGNIALIFLNKTKNKIVAVLLSYLSFFAVGILLYVILYAVILTNILSLDVHGAYFNILSYWSIYPQYMNYTTQIVSLIIYIIISNIIVFKLYNKKEKVVIANDKEKI